MPFSRISRAFTLFVLCVFFLFSIVSWAEQKTILLTGGTGYIGSHIAVVLLEHGYKVVLADNLSNSKETVLKRITAITHKDVRFYPIDIRDFEKLSEVFRDNKIFAVVHLAGFKSVKESTQKPLLYYDDNLNSTMQLLKVMGIYDCTRLVFSSSATVYGTPTYLPLDEKHPIAPVNPYGRTKAMNEDILRDLAQSDKKWSFISLRYFNPIGAHPSGLIGEDPYGVPNNLMPYILQVVAKKQPFLTVNGSDYPTKDGTGVRDYIHIVDLANAHLAAIEKMQGAPIGYKVYNIGTGAGYSVLEVIHAVEKATGNKLPYQLGPRRPGDVAEIYANPMLAQTELKWKAQFGLEQMAKDAINWVRKNPNGYNDAKCLCSETP